MMPSIRSCRWQLIFDHLPKTAGQAVNAWLINNLESGCVTQNMIGGHSDLIVEFGGRYPVISAHLAFNNEGFHPDYEYVTIFREPVDRAISWLYFILGHGCSEELIRGWKAVGADKYLCVDELFSAVQRFVESDGEEIHPVLLKNRIGHHLENPYVNHLLSIHSGGFYNNCDAIDLALDLVGRYKIWGLYERLPEFIGDLAALINVPVPSQITPMNVTRFRPKVGEISQKLRESLESLNALDTEFYRRLQAIYDEYHGSFQRPPLSETVE